MARMTLTSQWIFKILLWPAYDYYSSDSGTRIAFLDMCMVAWNAEKVDYFILVNMYLCKQKPYHEKNQVVTC